jgi:hypothetical protein
VILYLTNVRAQVPVLIKNFFISIHEMCIGINKVHSVKVRFCQSIEPSACDDAGFSRGAREVPKLKSVPIQRYNRVDRDGELEVVRGHRHSIEDGFHHLQTFLAAL